MKIQKPKLPKILEDFTFDKLLDDEFIERSLIENQKVVLDGQQNLTFDGCHLRRIDFFEQASLEVRFSFVDSVFQFCDFSNVSFSSESIIRCHFVESKFVGFDCTEELIRDVAFDHCDFTLANFSDIRFQNVCFQNCLFKDTRFFSCYFKNVEFTDSILENIEVFRTPLQDIDFSSSTLYGGKFCIEDLKGAIVSSEQALALSQLLGMVIRDE